MKRQLAYLLARAQIPIEWLHSHVTDEDGDVDVEGEAEYDEEEFPEDILECLNNVHLSQYFREFGKELGVYDPKSLEDVYKTHLENTSGLLSRHFEERLISRLCYRAWGKYKCGFRSSESREHFCQCFR